MEVYAKEAVSLSQATMGQKLDFTEESIKTVENILGRYHSEKERAGAHASPKIVDQVCQIYGAYIGEVMRRNYGGEWMLDDTFSPGTKIPALRMNQLQTSPSAKVYKRIMNGSEDDVWFYYQVFIGNFKKTIPKNS